MRWMVFAGLLPALTVQAAPLTGTQIAETSITGTLITGSQITEALTARVLGYAEGQTQTFFADGRTSYEGDRAEWGRWQVQGDQYCSQWPPSDRWTCYGITRDGGSVGFVSADGSVTYGRYIDLN